MGVCASQLLVTIELMPASCGPASQVYIRGDVYVDDVGTPAKAAIVDISVVNASLAYNDSYNDIIADSSGHYSTNITAPITPGIYFVNVTAEKGGVYGWNESALTINEPKPDPTFISPLTFSNYTPNEKDLVMISCIVENQGKVTAEMNITFYDGAPQNKGTLIDMKNISLAVDENATISINWSAVVGTHTIFAFIENCTPTDSNFTNNEVNASLEAADITLPEILSVTSKPSTPSSKNNVSIVAEVRDNTGIAKQNGSLLHYKVDEANEVVLNMTLENQDAYSAELGIFSANTIIVFYVEVTDLASNQNFSVNQSVTIAFATIDVTLLTQDQVCEKGTEIWVNGTALFDASVPLVDGNVECIINATYGPWTSMTDQNGNFALKIVAPETSGNHTVLVQVSFSGLYNNTTFDLQILEDVPDFRITIDDVVLSEAAPAPGDLVIINATVHNVGEVAGEATVSLYNGNPALGGVSVDISYVSVQAHGTALMQLQWTAEIGTFELWVVVSANSTERNLENNAVEKLITVYEKNMQEPMFNALSLVLISLNVILLIIIIVLVALIMKLRSQMKAQVPEKEEKEQRQDES